MISITIKQRYFFLIFALNIFLYGLVYFYPLNEFGEPQIPIYFKLVLDLFLVGVIFLFGFNKSFDLPQISYIVFLGAVLVFGLLHIYHTSPEDYLHYSIRNVFYYSLFFFINPFRQISLERFERFHQKVFNWVLYAGLLLFVLQIIGIPNPFGFAWMWEKNRLITSLLNPNSLGFYLIFYLFFYYNKFKEVNLKILLIVLSIFLTGSITAILGVVLSAFILLLIYVSGKKFKKIYVLLFTVLVPILAYGAYYFGVFDYIWFKIDVLFIQKDKTYTSVSTRIQNLIDLYNYFTWDNIISIFFGDFNTTVFRRLDNQYLNIFYNYGLITLLIYLLSLIAIIYKILTWKTSYAKPFLFFNLWLFFIAFNLTAYLFRPNLVVFYFIIYQYIKQSDKNEHSPHI